MYRKMFGFLSAVLLYSIVPQVNCENLKILHTLDSSLLEKYNSYADAVILNFQIPPDLQFVSLKFAVEEVDVSIFKCKPQDISIYVKEGSPPVINPDGSRFPERLLNVSRPDVYHLQMKSDKTPHYVNLTSPVAGTYFAVAFISWQDPTNAAITQQGLTAECLTYLDAVFYASNTTAAEIIIPNENFEITLNATSQIFKFYVPEFVDRAMIVINTATVRDGGNLIVRIDANRLPSVNNSLAYFILNSTIEFHTYQHRFWTLEENWHYLEFKTSDENVNVNFRLKFFTVTNDISSFLPSIIKPPTTNFYRTAIQRLYRKDTISEMIPYKQYNLVKSSSSDNFFYGFNLQTDLHGGHTINLTTSEFTVLKFVIEKGSDVGGSLQFSLAFSRKVKHYDQQIIVGCIRRYVREIPQYPNKCVFNGTTTTAPVLLNQTKENSTIYIPYVEPGIWYASFRLFNGSCEDCNCSEACNKQYRTCVDDCETNCNARVECEQCSLNCREEIILKTECKQCDCNGECDNNDDENKEVLANSNGSVLFDVSSYPCLAGRCGRNGRCVYMVSGGFAYSTCVCINNYRGWDCTDGTLANSYATILAELLLLVLSNVAFFPAIYFAYKRNYYPETIVYSSLCFFSTFYHACDAGENTLSFCLTKVAVLQFADFFTALLAIWVTLIAIADLPSIYPSLFHMIGAIFLAFGTTADRRSLWVFAVPAAFGIFLILARWLWYYKRNRFLPISKKYLYMNLPAGLLLVAVGLVVYAALQTNANYKYTHSFWHVVMAVAVVVLLPTKETFCVRNV